jgi:hypothetical protein
MFIELAGFLIFFGIVVLFLECWGQRTADKLAKKWDKEEDNHRKQTEK